MTIEEVLWDIKRMMDKRGKLGWYTCLSYYKSSNGSFAEFVIDDQDFDYFSRELLLYGKIHDLSNIDICVELGTHYVMCFKEKEVVWK